MKEAGKKPFSYMTLVGVIFLVVVLVALFNMLKTTDSGTVGIGEVGIGDRAAPFAVPLAMSGLDGDANIDPDEACSVEGADVLRICDYFERPLVMSFWFTKGASSCIDQQDVFDEVAAKYRDLQAQLDIIRSHDVATLREILLAEGEAERQAGLRAKQLFHWLYCRGASSFETMTAGRVLRISPPTLAPKAVRQISPRRTTGPGIDILVGQSFADQSFRPFPRFRFARFVRGESR